MKILHLADIHTDDQDLPEIQKCLDFTIKTAEEERPDLIVNAGDTFNSRSVKMDSASAKYICRAFKELADIAPVAIVTGTPSHDGHAVEIIWRIGATHNIWVSTLPEQICLLDGHLIQFQSDVDYYDSIDSTDAVISLVPTPTKKYFESDGNINQTDIDISNEMATMFAGFGASAKEYPGPHIMVGHFPVGGAYVSGTQQLTGVDIEMTREQISLAEADVVCLGHIHYHQQFGDNIFYSGSIYRKDFGELEEKGFYIHEIEKIPEDHEYKLISRFVETPSRKLIKDSVDLCAGVDESVYILSEAIARSPEEIKDAFVRLEFKVYQDEAEAIDKEQITGFYKLVGAADVDIKIIRVPRVNVRSEKILSLTTLREKLIERAALIDEKVPEKVLEKADILEEYNPDEIIKTIARI